MPPVQCQVLKSGSVQLNSIGRALQEKIFLRKVPERLSNHLGKPGLWQQVTTATLKALAASLRKCGFVIVDLSDITRKYVKNGRPGRVSDGSEGETGFGNSLCVKSVIAICSIKTKSWRLGKVREVEWKNSRVMMIAHRLRLSETAERLHW